MAHRPQ